MSTLPKFIEEDPIVITQELIAAYEGSSGKTLYPAQVERLLIDLLAYRESLVRSAINDTARQNLLAFARAPILDYLGELLGVPRLARTVCAGYGTPVFFFPTRVRVSHC